ncbi:uncharacterized protein LOC114941195 [Nylanderia fulva]|uniref:uncharacterized protein LOC114941195 n=1 Tax=Nylanderia fulva TaxID=613905 RepID=UPI0010FB789C|nr:uncharacterized protein LOC114941195 [Nylanderia fulva]
MEFFEFAAGDNYKGTLTDSENKAEIRVEDQNSILMPLINMLMNEQKFIDEIYFLDEFPSTDVILPVWNCSPKLVIEYLRNVHDAPYPKTCALSRIYYKYNINGINGPITREYVFTDDMSLVDDIIIICYLNCLESQDLNLLGIHHLFFMMRHKYNIVSAGTIYQALSPSRITWTQIMYSFPSVTWAYTAPSSSDMHMNVSISTMRKRTIWCNLIASVLPRLEADYIPIVYLSAIMIELIQILHENNAPFSRKIRLLQIYRHILSLYNSKAFPKSLKFTLCERRNIIRRVNEQHNQYKYDHFEQFYSVTERFLSDVESQVRNNSCNFLV